MSVAKFERFFRSAASLEVDKADLKRYSDFVQRKTYDLLLMAEAKAKANGQSARRDGAFRPADHQEAAGEHSRASPPGRQGRAEPILQGLAQLPVLDLA